MRHLPPLNAVRAFEAAARHESFARAAAELFVTAAAVSQQVKSLEDWLDVRLFERQPRGLALTPAGRGYLARLTELLDRLAEATETVKRLGHTSILTVGVTPGFAALWLGPRLWHFATQHPELDIRVAATVRPDEASHDSVDLSIRYGRGQYPGLISELLLKDGLAPLCSPRLLEGPYPLRVPEDLRHYTLLHNESALLTGFRATWQDWFDAAGVRGIDAHRGLHFSDLHLVIQEAVAGRGVALGHMALVGDELKAGRLVKPFELELAGGGDYYIVHPPGAEQLNKVAAFLSWLRAQVAAGWRPEGGAEAALAP